MEHLSRRLVPLGFFLKPHPKLGGSIIGISTQMVTPVLSFKKHAVVESVVKAMRTQLAGPNIGRSHKREMQPSKVRWGIP